jgi:hypothetical protein
MTMVTEMALQTSDYNPEDRPLTPVYTENDAIPPTQETAEMDPDEQPFDWRDLSAETTMKKAPPLERVRNLLELPVDILQMIVKEASQIRAFRHFSTPADRQRPQITHTNDLTSLALTNSTLHNLAVPLIYARFDIVWPDAHVTASDTKSVDALTYGLSTLCLGSTFAARTQSLLYPGRKNDGVLQRQRRRDYASFTKKFSLGNGPNDWVAEYMITKESGKMLGTLVALAIRKMLNLETFVWDMPTGVLSEIFLSLDSLRDHNQDGECKLERVWVRWHDNSDASSSSTSSSPAPLPAHQTIVPSESSLTPIGILLPTGSTHPAPRPAIPYSDSNVEYPTFSVLPPLKSLSVLEIDELPYLDEMSILIERSKDRLQELRVGISSKAMHKDFAKIWDGADLHQVDHDARWPGESSIGERRLGGVLGVLVGRIYDVRRKSLSTSKGKTPAHGVLDGSEAESHSNGNLETTTAQGNATENEGEEAPAANSNDATLSQAPDVAQPDSLSLNHSSSGPTAGDGAVVSRTVSDLLTLSQTTTGKESINGRKRLEGKLRLKTLELERVHLSMQVCSKAIDWTTLTTLTLLDCAQADNLWKVLRRQYMPTVLSDGPNLSKHSTVQYHLSLKTLHSDITTQHLILFLKDTLAPNSLEVLFLQDRRRLGGPTTVSIDQIFKGPVKRHRSSLRKLLLDSSDKKVNASTVESRRWTTWALSTEMLTYMTSGRMGSLRELAVSLDYRDWVSRTHTALEESRLTVRQHTFLQRLPNLPQLRSLNIANIANHAVDNFEPKELALQIVDIITLCPQIQLCYVGIASKCFEILEAQPSEGLSSSSDMGLVIGNNAEGNDSGLDGDDDDDNSDDDTASQLSDASSDETDDDDTPVSVADGDEAQPGEAGDGSDSDEDSFRDEVSQGPNLRLREILFYDDKVAIFKARHGRL